LCIINAAVSRPDLKTKHILSSFYNTSAAPGGIIKTSTIVALLSYYGNKVQMIRPLGNLFIN
jgi:hypothetical protein